LVQRRQQVHELVALACGKGLSEPAAGPMDEREYRDGIS
jgi:hypothetical protein